MKSFASLNAGTDSTANQSLESTIGNDRDEGKDTATACLNLTPETRETRIARERAKGEKRTFAAAN
jgi:hypothetical protein